MPPTKRGEVSEDVQTSLRSLVDSRPALIEIRRQQVASTAAIPPRTPEWFCLTPDRPRELVLLDPPPIRQESKVKGGRHAVRRPKSTVLEPAKLIRVGPGAAAAGIFPYPEVFHSRENAVVSAALDLNTAERHTPCPPQAGKLARPRDVLLKQPVRRWLPPSQKFYVSKVSSGD